MDTPIYCFELRCKLKDELTYPPEHNARVVKVLHPAAMPAIGHQYSWDGIHYYQIERIIHLLDRESNPSLETDVGIIVFATQVDAPKH